MEALLMQNYLPRQHDHREELPPIFHSRLFSPDVAEALRKTPSPDYSSDGPFWVGERSLTC